MRNLIAWTAACALMGACAGERSPDYWAARGVRANPLLATCDADLQRLDFSKLEPAALEDFEAHIAPRHAATRGPNYPFPDVSDAQIVLRMFAAGDPHQQEFTDTSSLVWKDAQGIWRVHAVHYRARHLPIPRPPGEPPYTDEEFDDLRRRVDSGRLEATRAALPDETMNDVCLAQQPDYVPLSAPMLDGTESGCFGGLGGGVLEITQAGRTRRIADACARFAAGALMRIVLYPRLEPEA